MLKFGLRVAFLLGCSIVDAGGANALQDSTSSRAAHAGVEQEVAQLRQTVRMLQSELIRTKTYGQASTKEGVVASTGATSQKPQAPSTVLEVHAGPKDKAEPLSPPTLVSSINKHHEKALGNNSTHTAAYRQCYLHPHTNKFSIPPSNFVLSDEGFLYFEIPKVSCLRIDLQKLE